MKIKRINNHKVKATLFIILMSLFGIQSANAIQLSAGSMVLTNLSADPSTPAPRDYTTLTDGIMGTSAGYSTTGAETIINWDVNPFSRLTIEPDQRVDKYTYTITLHSGLGDFYNLNNFSFSHSNGTSNTTVTTFNSLTSNNGGTITSNAEGLVSASASSVLAQHTVSFDVGSDIESITLNIPAAGQNGNWVLSEITGTVTAEVSQIPEPSTYALLLGFISLVVIAFKKRIKA